MARTHVLTMNREFADHILVAELAAQSYEETLIREITWIDRSARVIIDKAKRTLQTVMVDFEENTVDIDSPEGLEILDTWYRKWTGVIRDISQKSSNLVVDLSGGFDSRMVFLLFAGSGIDLNQICVICRKS